MKTGLSIAALLLASSAPAWGATAKWSVSERSGSVSVLHGGISRIAVKDGDVDTGDVIATGVNGRAVLVRGEEFLVVAPNSRLRIADPEQSGGLVQIIEEAGNVIFRIKRMTMQHFAVKTPYLAAVVKGTTFSVSVGPEGASVQVIEGAVEVATPDGGARDLVRPGMVAAVSARDLGRLKVDGDTSRVIVSPNAPAAPAPESQPLAPAVVTSSDRIDAPVSEPSVSVAELTGGMVEGSAALPIVVASTSVLRQTVAMATTAVPASVGKGETVVETVTASPADVAPVAPAATALTETVAPGAPGAASVPTLAVTAEAPVTSAPVEVAAVVPAPIAPAPASVVETPVATASVSVTAPVASVATPAVTTSTAVSIPAAAAVVAASTGSSTPSVTTVAANADATASTANTASSTSGNANGIVATIIAKIQAVSAASSNANGNNGHGNSWSGNGNGGNGNGFSFSGTGNNSRNNNNSSANGRNGG